MKVLLIRLGSAGDILLCAGAVKALKEQKGAGVHILVKKKFAQAAELTGADRVIPFEFKGGISEIVSLAGALSAEKYDMIVDMQSNVRSLFLCAVIKCPVKRRIKKEGVKRRFSLLFKWFLKGGAPVKARYLEAAAVNPPLQEKRRIKKSGIVVLHAGAMWKNKRWPYMAELAKKLVKLKKVKRVVITGVKDEVEKGDELLYIKSKGISLMLGKTDFKRLAGIIKGASLFIGNDTAAAHIAALYSVPAVVFLGPTVVSFGFVNKEDFVVLEKDLGCRPCHLHGGKKCPVGHFECMRSISTKEALKAAEKILSGVR